MGVGEEDSNHQLMKGVGSELNRKAARVIVPWARVKFNQSRRVMEVRMYVGKCTLTQIGKLKSVKGHGSRISSTPEVIPWSWTNDASTRWVRNTCLEPPLVKSTCGI